MMIRFEDAKKYFYANTGAVKAVDGVSLSIEKGDSFGIIGESGCGKTTLGKLALGILKADSGRVTRATDRIQVIFQDPYNSLDPKMKIYDILAEGLVIRSCADTGRRVGEVLDLIRLPKTALKKYPHQFSGGERQRIAIGRAVLTEPEFIVCDEPVSSLDVTIQLEILKLLKEIQASLGMTYLFISHDLKAVRFICNRIAVMRSGRIVESGPAGEICRAPAQDYTRKLFSSSLTIIP